MQVVRLVLPYKPKGAQWEFYDKSTRFTIARIGRQWGKSMMAMLRGIRRSNPGGIYWWAEPTIPQSKIHMRRMVKYFRNFIDGEPNYSERFINLKTGGTWFFKGMDNPENNEGETLDGIVLDEAAKYPGDVWYGTVKPMLAVKGGWADVIGKPRGNNWYQQLWFDTINDKEWSHIHLPSNSSPFFSDSEMESARLTTPQDIFRQEYLAEFVDNAGMVFRNVQQAVHGVLEEPQIGRNYYAGVDLAKTVDWTVIVIMDNRKNVVAYDRFQDLSWKIQKDRIVRLCKKYNANTFVDSTGVGDPILEDLQRSGVKASGYKFTNQSKRVLIESLQLDFEHGKITLPDIPEMIQELNTFEVEQLPSGLLRFSAPPGRHDDTVIALALVNYFTIPIVGNMIETGATRESAGMGI